MLQELFYRLFSPGISVLVSFVSIMATYDNNCLKIESTLSNPVTHESLLLIKEGYVFKTDYSINVIVNNNEKAFSLNVQVAVKYSNGNWLVNDSIVDYSMLQHDAGTIQWLFKGIKFDENDGIKVFVKAKLLPDSLFFKSTGLQSATLWDYYVPRKTAVFILKSGIFSEQ